MANPPNLPDDQEQFKLNEVCKLANVQPYMLRFWGTEFPQLEAMKSGTGQRLYSRQQVALILEIRRLLFDEGLTIAGARKRVVAIEKAGGIVEVAADEKPTKKPAKKTATKAATPPRTSSARRRKTEEVDKTPSENVQPLLATLKDVRTEIDKIVADLKSE
ncbi:MAG: MerR family transcriptional regulator [Thermoanaerobaculales bacterium]